jgi:hypothetical protein
MRGVAVLPVSSWLRQALARLVTRWRTRFEEIIDSMFGFELRDEELKHLSRRRTRKR